MSPKLSDEVHSWKNHRHGPVDCSKLQFFPEVCDRSNNLFVLDINSRKFIRLKILAVRGFDNAVLRMAVLNDTGQTVLERSQLV
jgi:hypothetical protein